MGQATVLSWMKRRCPRVGLGSAVTVARVTGKVHVSLSLLILNFEWLSKLKLEHTKGRLEWKSLDDWIHLGASRQALLKPV